MPKDMQKLMQQAQRMQEELAKAQQQLAERTYEGTAGGGVVKATVRGTGELVEITFDPAVLDPDDPELVGDLVVAAVNQAHHAAQQDASETMGGLGGGLDVGGLGGLIG